MSIKTYTLNHYLDRDEGEISVIVEYEYTPADRGSLDGEGRQVEPDSPENLEIISVKNEKGTEILLIEKAEAGNRRTEKDRLLDACHDDVQKRLDNQIIERFAALHERY